MRFWDASALVPLITEEVQSRACRHALRVDKVQIVWCLSRTEVTSALCRRRREDLLDAHDLERASRRLDVFAERWVAIDAVDAVRTEAERLLRVHPLRAADALQLAAARVWVDGRPKGRVFVGLDEGLLDAARGEGFDVIAPQP